MFLGLWGIVIPPFVSQVPDVVENVQQGAGQLGDAAAPDRPQRPRGRDAIQKGREELKGGQVAGKVLTGQGFMQWAAAVILILVLTFFFSRPAPAGTTAKPFTRDRQPELREVCERAGARSAPTCRRRAWSRTIYAVHGA